MSNNILILGRKGKTTVLQQIAAQLQGDTTNLLGLVRREPFASDGSAKFLCEQETVFPVERQRFNLLALPDLRCFADSSERERRKIKAIAHQVALLAGIVGQAHNEKITALLWETLRALHDLFPAPSWQDAPSLKQLLSFCSDRAEGAAPSSDRQIAYSAILNPLRELVDSDGGEIVAGTAPPLDWERTSVLAYKSVGSDNRDRMMALGGYSAVLNRSLELEKSYIFFDELVAFSHPLSNIAAARLLWHEGHQWGARAIATSQGSDFDLDIIENNSQKVNTTFLIGKLMGRSTPRLSQLTGVPSADLMQWGARANHHCFLSVNTGQTNLYFVTLSPEI